MEFFPYEESPWVADKFLNIAHQNFDSLQTAQLLSVGKKKLVTDLSNYITPEFQLPIL